MAHRVAVIGAGYAGMAAAVELASAGASVEVFEASRTLGGRARGIDIDGVRLDNGAHILVGAYGETLRLMRLVGAPADALRRQPLELVFPGKFAIRAPRLPAPLHLGAALAAARGLTVPEKLAAIRFMRQRQREGFRLARDTTVADLLAAEPAVTRRFLWEPLCLAALNTPPDEASAQVFLNVLRDSLAGRRAASDLLLPATDFSALFPEPAARFVEKHGGHVWRATRIGALARSGGRWFADGHGPYDRVIVAVAPWHLARLFSALPEAAPILETIGHFESQPIVTAYLAYDGDVRLPAAMVGVDGGTAQWLFDRGHTHGQRGLIAAVISARGGHLELAPEQLVAAIHRDIAGVLPRLSLPRWSRVITEKRATFACTPSLPRPSAVTPLSGLLLAGDYVAGDYPATIEGAVTSGVNAARSLLECQPPCR